MVIYRICKEKYAHSLSGDGARLTGGRWNSKGNSVVYASSTLSLATLEILVHVSFNIIPKKLVSVEIDLPDTLNTKTIYENDLPADWNRFPAPRICATLGDEWITSLSSPVLIVPSAIVKTKNEFNLLLNPLHPDFREIEVKNIEPYQIDGRLFSHSSQ